MPRRHIPIKLECEGKRFSVPWARAIVGLDGIYLRNLQLPQGAHVLVEIIRGNEELKLSGIASWECEGSATVIRFDRDEPNLRRKLVSLLAT